MQAIDTPYSVQGNVHTILAAGYHGIIRYISPATEKFPTKQLTAAEASPIHSVPGMKIGLVFEQAADHVEYFTLDQAAEDIGIALGVLDDLSIPNEIPAFFAVDFDASDDDLTDAIQPYFDSIHTKFSEAGRLMGVYGSGNSCSTLKDAGVVHYTWLAQSRGWDGYLDWKTSADIIQGPSNSVAGLDVDTDFVVNEALLW